ncbi:MAG: hypothetical protein R3192_00205 [Woeseiaceae bacterium]|nr:hypothetical protein [Woeseiaceae bacterium]
METALSIFLNGITGVFIGMALTYLTMKLIALLGAIGTTNDKTE